MNSRDTYPNVSGTETNVSGTETNVSESWQTILGKSLLKECSFYVDDECVHHVRGHNYINRNVSDTTSDTASDTTSDTASDPTSDPTSDTASDPDRYYS